MSNRDYYDVLLAQGAEVTASIIAEGVKRLSDPLDPSKKDVWNLREILKMERPEVLIQGVLVLRSLAALVGPTGSWKSFMAFLVAYSVATGTPFLGRRTKTGGVLILAGEGVYGTRSRFKALLKQHGRTEPPDNLFIRSGLNLGDADDLSWMKSFITENDIQLVIIDTLARSFSGDENSSKDMGAAIRSIDANIIGAGATCLLVHHTGHGDSSRARGSSAFRAALDTEIGVERIEGGIRATCWKQKDLPPFDDVGLRSVVVETGDIDEFGVAETSLVLEEMILLSKQAALSKQEAEVASALRLLPLPFTLESAQRQVKEATSLKQNIKRIVVSTVGKLIKAGELTQMGEDFLFIKGELNI